MAKVALIYWSGTGNTTVMKDLVVEGIKSAGGPVDVYMPWDFKPEQMADYTHFAFGCPAMGDEQLETEDFQPLWDDINPDFKDKNIVLFGSYNWNNGEWMDYWGQEAVQAGANLVADGLPVLDAPDSGSDEADACIKLGQAIAKA